MTLTPGARLGPYQVVAPLAAGGMGEVYRARDTRLGREVAIKVLPAEVADDAERLRRFEQEARAVSALNHPHILTVFDFGTENGTTYLVTELLDGRSLREALQSGEAIPARKAIDWGAQIARALAAAHDKGIVHRDLKPENLFLTREGLVKILDFGLAKLTLPMSGSAIDAATTIAGGTATGVVMGTVGYMAPEQVRGERVDARADLFSFGCVLYELLSGRRAFRGATHADTLSAILRDEPPPLAARDAAAPIAPGLAHVVERCLAKEPIERWQSARDLGDRLNELAGSGSDLRAPSISPVPAQSSPTGAARRWRTLAVAAVALAALTATLALIPRGTSPGLPPEFRPLTFRRGEVLNARFAPDGQTVVYSAAWEGRATELFVARLDSLEARPLGVPRSNLLAVSSAGSIAVTLDTRQVVNLRVGTLAEMPLSGGAAPRAIADGIVSAAYRPGVETLLVGRSRGFEFPRGQQFLASRGDVALPRFSPDGSQLAFAETGIFSSSGTPNVTGLDGRPKALGTAWSDLSGLAWAPSGKELWVSGQPTDRPAGIYALAPGGETRRVWQGPESLRLLDVDHDGRALVARDDDRIQMFAWRAGDTSEHEVSWLDASRLSTISADGNVILFSDRSGSSAQTDSSVYLRHLDAGLPVRLAAGRARDLSRDQRWALVQRGPFDDPQLTLVPTGAGTERRVDIHGVDLLGAKLLPDGAHILITGRSTQTDLQGQFVAGLDGSGMRSITPAGTHYRYALSNDGRWSIGRRRDSDSFFLYPVEPNAGPPRPAPGVGPDDFAIAFTADDRGLYVTNFWTPPPWKIEIVDLETGARKLWKEIRPPDPTGLVALVALDIAPDGSAYAYSYSRRFSTLYLAEGLR